MRVIDDTEEEQVIRVRVTLSEGGKTVRTHGVSMVHIVDIAAPGVPGWDRAGAKRSR